MEKESPITGIQAAIDAGKHISEIKTPLEGVVLAHSELKRHDLRSEFLQELKRTKEAPVNRAEKIRVNTIESFIALTQRNTEEYTESTVFSDIDEYTITTVFDYHEWQQFTAFIKFTISQKLKKWLNLKESQSQVAFAYFIEEHAKDVTDGDGEFPSGSELLKLSNELEATQAFSYKGKNNLQNGDVSLQFQGETSTTVEIPKKIKLAIPLFQGGGLYGIEAFLRYRVGNGGIKFWLDFDNVQDALEQEFEKITQETEEKLGLSIIRGALLTKY